MNIGKAFSYAFEDAQWLMKGLFYALFLLLSLILVGIPFILGYDVRTIRNVHRGEPTPLPEWTDLGGMFTEGIKLFAVIFVFYLPSILISCCSNALTIGLSGGSSSSSQNSGAAGALVAVSLLLSCIQLIYSLLVAVLIPAIVIRFAQTGEIGACFRIGDLVAMLRRVPGPYVITLLLSVIVLPIIASLGFILCVIGVVLTGTYAYFVVNHLYGQLWQQMDQAPMLA